MDNQILSTVIFFLGLIVAITIHEFAHAFTADHFGDPTPRSYGRVSLNPLRHLDPFGTIMLILVQFGWGKPVPIDPYNLSRKEELFVSLAGVVTNFIFAIFCSILIFFLTPSFFTLVLSTFVYVNILLAVFNFLPVPPLDGSKVFLYFLPQETAVEWEKAFNQYGIILLAALLFLPIGGSNIVSLIISPVIRIILGLLLPIR